MLSRMNVYGICLIFVCVLVPSSGRSQETVPVTPTANANVRDSEEIPFSVLQQIVSGMQFNGEIKSDIPKEQIDAMKKVQYTQYAKNSDLNQLTSMMFSSSLKNRRFNQALATLKAESEAELHKEWLAMITPEQQASIRRRNRTVMMQASLNRQQPAQDLLYGDASVDTLMTNNDLLSVVERPAIQDILELTDQQFEKIEELQLAAEVDAVSTLRQTMKLLSKTNDAPATAPTPSPVWEQLNADTMKILTAAQVAEFKALISNPARMQELFGAEGIKNPESIFRAMMPHGVTTRISTTVVDDKVKVEAEFNNAFASSVVATALNLTDEQQAEIAELLTNSRDDLLAEMEARTEVYNKQRRDRNDEVALSLKTHNERFHAQAVSLMTPLQMQKLEKECLKGIGLWALKKPQVSSALELTEEQMKSIEEILSLRAPVMQMISPTIGGDFQKESEAFHKRARENHELVMEHIKNQKSDLQKLLSESQQNKFTEMTGHQFLTGSSI